MVRAGLEAVQEIGGALRVARSEIGPVVVANLRRDAQIRAQKRAAQLPDQFLGGIGVIARAIAERAVKAR